MGTILDGTQVPGLFGGNIFFGKRQKNSFEVQVKILFRRCPFGPDIITVYISVIYKARYVTVTILDLDHKMNTSMLQPKVGRAINWVS